MIPLIKEVVLKYHWLNETQFLNMIGVSEITPGPIAINMATYIGSTQGGLLGSLISTIGVVLPSFIIMLLVSIVLKKVIKNSYVQGALKGIKGVAIALICSSGITLLADVLFPYKVDGLSISFTPQLTAIKIFVLVIAGYFLLKIILKKKPGPIAVIILSAIIGLMVNYLR